MLVKFQTLFDGIHVIPGVVNRYILETKEGLALFDTGFPGGEKKIFQALQALGRPTDDVRHIILSHAHPDHMGGAAAIKRATGATIWAHPIDAPLIESGKPIRAGMTAAPGLKNLLLTSSFKLVKPRVHPVQIDELVNDGDRMPFLDDFTAIHVPGHSAGQLAFHWKRDGGILFPADACVHKRQGAILPFAVENLRLALDSLQRLKSLDFDSIMFMHGSPVVTGGRELFDKARFG